MTAVALGALLACVAACERIPLDSGSPIAQQPSRPDCLVDDDCGLMPAAMTCCGECDPVPPFDAVPRTAIDAVLIELETRCAAKPTVCEPVACDWSPPGCEATATCVRGRCTVVQSIACEGALAKTH